MNARTFFRIIQLFIFLGFMALMGALGGLAIICGEISREIDCSQKFGPGWQAEYPAEYGPLWEGRMKIVGGLAAMGAVAWAVTAIYRQLSPNKHRTNSGAPPKRRHRRFHSSEEKHRFYRRRGLLGVGAGLVTIAISLGLVSIRWGIFAEHSNEVALGIVVFLPGYCSVIFGCASWLKSKAWDQSVVLIGLFPLIICFIPFVRLIYLASPAILPAGMVMMPLILVVVVLVLPDKSGVSSRRR